jgi:hypothetical protein
LVSWLFLITSWWLGCCLVVFMILLWRWPFALCFFWYLPTGQVNTLFVLCICLFSLPPCLPACLHSFWIPGRLGGRWEIGWCREARSRSGLTGEDYLPGFSGFSAYDASVALFIWVFYGYIFRILLDKGVWCSMVMMVGSMPRRLGPFSFIFIFISSA